LPNVRADSVNVIREGFDRTILDEARINDGKQKQPEFDPSTAESQVIQSLPSPKKYIDSTYLTEALKELGRR
jgi:hypothetical protein